MGDKGLKTVLATEAEIDRVCKAAAEQIQAKVLAHTQRHPGNAFSGHYLVDLEKSMKALYAMTGVKVAGQFKKNLPKVMREYYAKAAEDMKTRGTRNAILGKVDERRINDQLDSAFTQVAMRTDKMSFEHIRQLRKLSAEVLRTATLTGASRKEVTKQLLGKAQEIPGFKFVANNEVVWDTQAYFKMLARTELMQAGRRSYQDKCAEEGYDVVQLSYGGNSCEACERWEGKVFSLTGATPGLPTLADLEADGVFHPNCVHSYTALTDFELAEMGLEIRQPGTADDRLEDTAPIDVPAGEARDIADGIEARRSEWPGDPNGLKVVKQLGGSTGAELVEDADGNRYVRKRGGSAGGDAAGHLRNECAADNFYRAMGIDVPENRLYETAEGPVKLARFIDGGESLAQWWSNASDMECEEMLAKLRPGFDLDVVTGNWDVIGMEADNILVDKNGTPWRIDNGGAFGYRAQGMPKKPEEWSAGWPDDVWSMRTSDNNLPYFGYVDTLDLCQSISGRDYAKALEGLPEADRQAIQKRLDEVRQLAERGAPFRETGYMPEHIDAMLKGSYDLSKDGLREKMRFKVKLNSDGWPTSYGAFRTGETTDGYDATEDRNEEVQVKVLAAVKTVNFHNGKPTGKEGSGDGQPNMASVNAAVALKPDLKKEADKGSAGAAYYLQKIEQMEQAVKAGTTIKGKMLDTSVEAYVPRKKGNVAKDDRSFTTRVFADIAKQTIEYKGKTIPLDPEFIAKSQEAQGGASYSPDACKMKIARLNALGIKAKDAEKSGYFVGKGSLKENFMQAAAYYRAKPEELARDTETLMRYQGALQLMLENTDLPYVDRESRTILLGRIEKKDVVKGRPGTETTHKRGVNESHGMFHTVVVEGDQLTVVRVPFDRVSGCYLAERNPGSDTCGFLYDRENEMTADTRGLRVLHVGEVDADVNLKPYFDKFIEWEKKGYK
jgi:hypothetical protein